MDNISYIALGGDVQPLAAALEINNKHQMRSSSFPSGAGHSGSSQPLSMPLAGVALGLDVPYLSAE